MHTIILAAGNGSRLDGIVPIGLKPLLLVNGEPLIKRLVRQAAGVSNDITVVVSPTNVGPIIELIGPSLDYVVQPTPFGPGDALLRGLRGWDDARCMVLLGDNWLPDGTIEAVRHVTAELIISGFSTSARKHALRFTRIFTDPETGRPKRSEEGGLLSGSPPWDVWCGPLLAPEDILHRVLHDADSVDGEKKIGPHITTLLSRVENSRFVYCDAKDVGTPEALV